MELKRRHRPSCRRARGRLGRGGWAPAGSAGFTLIETLLALIVFVACYLLVHHSVALGWRGLQTAHREALALDVGQNLLAGAGLEAPLSEGQHSGRTDDGYEWTLSVARFDPAGSGPELDRLAAFRIAAVVSWREPGPGRARSLELETVKLGPRP